MAFHNPHHIDHDGAGREFLSDSVVDRTTDAMAILARSPKLLAEVGIDEAHANDMHKAIKANDKTAIADLYLAACARHAEEMVDGCIKIHGSRYETAMSLLRAYA